MLGMVFGDVVLIFIWAGLYLEASDSIFISVSFYRLGLDDKFPMVVNYVSSLTILFDFLAKRYTFDIFIFLTDFKITAAFFIIGLIDCHIGKIIQI